MSRPVNLVIRCLVDSAARLEALLLPSRCLVCEGDGLPGIDLCDACRFALPWLADACPGCGEPLDRQAAPPGCARCRRDPLPLDGVCAVFRYAPPVDQLLLRFKFHQDLAAGRLLATLMAEHLSSLPAPPVLVPLALHPQRLRARGYDQGAQLARALSRRLAVPCQGLLRRRHATAAQSGLDAASRQHNLRDAFVCPRRAPPQVVLFDDVMTTGASLRAAATAMRLAGATHVAAWVCARAVKGG
ncbi:MAG TPA: ComF family protein [Stenotrophomonas sp.]|jgi:ComF family protein